ncbi:MULTISPECIES: helix-turn-helix transcriptional regulator [Streptomyces]|uniref:Helix-turn-helix transcriptional regulator n=2 Tax=Streptomyces TaxID=1883 RepID=A0ABY9JP50_9ACTN|nr:MULTISPECIES: helix-turn-helix transcriptional regulator [unclassified Streptomyces]WLQ68809.1 helix-turn-helix transcriptional regulator [Streptomyces sp. Alt3]WSQ75619.1 helix-turn-helix domain-containing protein [Streptomyces sp. NBC_01213]WSR11161.1 helix-turn-helix domain-containing protein [Streptomyces sp. NBC_01208]WSR52807.1 helix-turn-helix domain-containing protein [Streptomyces sp. NBC_01201]
MPKDAAVEEFAGLVRALKARDGRSYEALGRRLSVSASTLHRYCSGATVPEEFAVVDRLALLCGADEEERRAMEAAWTEADRARRRAASPAPTPVPAVSAAPESNPDPSAPEPGPGPAPDPTAPDPSAADLSATEAPRTRPRRGAPAPLLLAVAVALVVLALAAVLLGDPTRTASAPAPASTAPGRTAAPLPFTWSIGSQLWEGGCGHTYLVDRAPRAVAPPPVAADSGAWARTHGAVHGGEALVRITIQGRSPSDAVVLHALHVRVVDRAAPLLWNAYRMDNGCGGAVTPRHFAVDLDRPRPLARPVDGLDASGAEVRKIPAVSFPYKVTSSDPEELLVSARTAGCDCRWYLEMEWSAGGRTGTVRITDGGKPFRTSGTRGRPVYVHDSAEGRWITDSDSGQTG